MTTALHAATNNLILFSLKWSRNNYRYMYLFLVGSLWINSSMLCCSEQNTNNSLLKELMRIMSRKLITQYCCQSPSTLIFKMVFWTKSSLRAGSYNHFSLYSQSLEELFYTNCKPVPFIKHKLQINYKLQDNFLRVANSWEES